MQTPQELYEYYFSQMTLAEQDLFAQVAGVHAQIQRQVVGIEPVLDFPEGDLGYRELVLLRGRIFRQEAIYFLAIRILVGAKDNPGLIQLHLGVFDPEFLTALIEQVQELPQGSNQTYHLDLKRNSAETALEVLHSSYERLLAQARFLAWFQEHLKYALSEHGQKAFEAYLDMVA